ncbi:hypothetical protein PsorP6_001330 [Peronosclerospora sorghi]|uniref:Uncharacterized protein n=1 Tax=Peronosclerospora sorghi TaxID=230839 RepID=A0ACC0WVV7_9STRA|nr:hypothetical protein PsorP6_001330 [Peronosclerospora sorghi]
MLSWQPNDAVKFPLQIPSVRGPHDVSQRSAFRLNNDVAWKSLRSFANNKRHGTRLCRQHDATFDLLSSPIDKSGA